MSATRQFVLYCAEAVCELTNARRAASRPVVMPPPMFVVCEICGKKFSKHSLGIHQKQCIKKAEASMVRAHSNSGHGER
jgi:hypothetical protein